VRQGNQQGISRFWALDGQNISKLLATLNRLRSHFPKRWGSEQFGVRRQSKRRNTQLAGNWRSRFKASNSTGIGSTRRCATAGLARATNSGVHVGCGQGLVTKALTRSSTSPRPDASAASAPCTSAERTGILPQTEHSYRRPQTLKRCDEPPARGSPRSGARVSDGAGLAGPVHDAWGSTMSIKLSETQLALLSAASQSEDLLLTPPKGARLAQARKAAAKLIEAGLVREVKAKKGAPVWRRDEEARCDYALKVTATGLKAITAEAEAQDPFSAARAASDDAPDKATMPDAEPKLASNQASGTSKAVSPRAGTKIAEVIARLGRAEGATISELIAATGWLPHTTRAALTGLRKRGYALTLDRSDRTRGSIHRIATQPPSEPSTDRGVVEEAAQAAGGSCAVPASIPRARRRAAKSEAVAAASREAP
jgi:uncharacterized protein DUF3489